MIKEVGKQADTANQAYPMTVVLTDTKGMKITPGMAELGISMSRIFDTLNQQRQMVDAGGGASLPATNYLSYSNFYCPSTISMQ